MDGFYPSLSSPPAPPPPPPPPRRPAPLPPSPTKNFPSHSSSFTTDGMYRMYQSPPPPPPPPPPSAPPQPSQSFQVPYPPSSITMNVHYPPAPPPPPPPPPQFRTTVPPNSDPQFYPPGTVVIQVGSQAPVPWSTGLFDCSDDVGNCCMTCCCPCVTFGQIAEIVDRGSPSCGTSGGLYAMIMCLTGCHWMYSCFYRSKMRGQFLLEEGPIADCPVHFCCDCCALCQEYRELKYRGYDLFGGWEASMERKRKRAMRPPAVQVSMRR